MVWKGTNYCLLTYQQKLLYYHSLSSRKIINSKKHVNLPQWHLVQHTYWNGKHFKPILTFLSLPRKSNALDKFNSSSSYFPQLLQVNLEEDEVVQLYPQLSTHEIHALVGIGPMQTIESLLWFFVCLHYAANLNMLITSFHLQIIGNFIADVQFNKGHNVNRDNITSIRFVAPFQSSWSP